jgi:hypothetical protein
MGAVAGRLFSHSYDHLCHTLRLRPVVQGIDGSALPGGIPDRLDWKHEHRFCGTKSRTIYGSKTEVIELLGKSTAYIKRSNLTSRTFEVRQTHKSLAFSGETINFQKLSKQS